MALLLHHGLSAEAIRAVAEVGSAATAVTRSTGIEHAALVDATGGSVVGGMLAGQSNQVDLQPHLRAMLPDHAYVQIHTHPGGSSFSLDDALILVTHERIRSMVVVGTDAWFVLSKWASGPVPAPHEVILAHTLESARARQRFGPLVAAGQLSPEGRRRVETHEIWQAIAPLLGLRYDRIETQGGAES